MWFLPTRNRPEKCRKTLEAIAELGPSSGVVFMDGCCYDDLELPEGWRLCGSARQIELGGVLRWAFQAYRDEDFYGFISDDMIPRTPEWAAHLELAAGPWGMSSSNDLWKGNQRMAGALCFGGRLLRTLGYWVPEDMCHLYIDDVWETLGKELGCWTYRKDIVVEHLHPAAGKGERDATYVRELNGEPYSDRDRRLFEGWLKTAEADMARVRLAQMRAA